MEPITVRAWFRLLRRTEWELDSNRLLKRREVINTPEAGWQWVERFGWTKNWSPNRERAIQAVARMMKDSGA